ncbi:MAG: hypothetical protein RSA53_05530 [Odoribacter sp.]
MFQLKCKITIKGTKTWIFERIAGCEISLDSETLTDTCTIRLPKKITWANEAGVPLKRGDAVSVELGYDEELKTRFLGYIRTVGTKIPVEINCEDSMWMLKKTAVKKLSYTSVTIDKLLKDILPPEVDYKVFGEQNIGQYRITVNTVAEVLDNLKENGIRSFFKLTDGKPILYCGLFFPALNGKKTFFKSGLNVIENNTEFRRAEDIKLKVKATSLRSDNKRTEVTVGDDDGEVRSIFKCNVDKKELESWAKQELEVLKSDGLTGSIKTFGVPEVDKGDHIYVEADESPKGLYSVKKVEIEFGENGYRQTIELDRKL